MKKFLPNMIRILLSFMIVTTVAMAIFWTPNAILYANELVSEADAKSAISATAFSLSLLLSVIALTVFIVSFKFPIAIKKETIFTIKTASTIKLIAILVLCDCILLAVGIAILFALGDILLSPALAFVDIIGVAVSAMLFVLSKYVKDASYLKEEVDHTL